MNNGDCSLQNRDGMQTDGSVYYTSYDDSYVSAAAHGAAQMTKKKHLDIVSDSQKSARRSENRKAFKSKSLPPCDNIPIVRPVPLHATNNLANITLCEYAQPSDLVNHDWEKGVYCDPVETNGLNLPSYPQHKLHNDPLKGAFEPGVKPDRKEPEEAEEDIYELAQNLPEFAVKLISAAHDKTKVCSSDADNSKHIGPPPRHGSDTHPNNNIYENRDSVPLQGNKKDNTAMRRFTDPGNNYEEPWDTSSQNRFFSTMFPHQASADIVFRQNREESPCEHQTEQKKIGKKIKAGGNASTDHEEKQVSEKTSNNVDSNLAKIESETATYEDPWDSSSRQRLFEEKLLEMNLSQKQKLDRKNSSDKNVRKLSSDKDSHFDCVDGSEDSVSTQTRKSSGPKTSNPPTYEDPWDIRPDIMLFNPHLPVVECHKKPTAPAEVPSSLTSRGSTPITPTVHQHGPLVEYIDSSTPLSKQQFFHRSLSRGQADGLIVRHRPGSYLIRPSETQQDSYSLSIKSVTGAPMHIRITKVNHKYILGENSSPFDTIPDMVDYYTLHHLPIINMERIYLTHPIHSQNESYL